MVDIADPMLAGETGYYRQVIQQYDRAAEKWHRRGKKIVKRYLDERPEGQANGLRYNILWSNVETLKPAIYAKTPKPEVERRFLDKDPVGRVASEVLERCISYFVAQTPFGSTMRQARDDYLLPGRGIAWVRYVPHLTAKPGKPPADPKGQVTDDAAPTEEQISYEEVVPDYVHWQDFGHNVARVWEEVSVVWRIVYLTREQLKKRFPETSGEVTLDYVPKELKDNASEGGKKATVYEIWDKDTRTAYWIAKTYNKFLDKRTDPLGLDKFFPCSRPIYATLSSDSLIPVPDYAEYQDQAHEIDQLTQRIGLLQKAIKAAGVYDASQKGVERLLTEGVQNTLIPVDSWAAMIEKGGLKGSMELLPMEEIAKTLLMLYEAREKVKQDLYEITGMSDIIRGATKASETATAQQIKSNFVTLRLSEKQREVQRFARNTVEIMGNVIARLFSLDTIKKISGVKLLTEQEKQAIQARSQMQQMPAPGMQPMQPSSGHMPGPSAPAEAGPSGPQNPSQGTPSQGMPELPPEIQEMMSEPSWDQVYALLRDNPDRCFRISIETDSTVEADQQQEQESAMQFVTALGGFMKQVQEAGANPAVMPFLGEVMAWAVRRFPVGRDLEGAVDQMIEKLSEQAKNPEPKPDPAMAKVQQEGQIAQQQMQQDGQLEQMRMQGQAQLEQIKAQIAEQAEAAKAQREQQQAMMEADREDRRAAAEHQREIQQMQSDAMMDRFKALLDARTKIEVAEIGAGAALETAQITAAKAGTDD